MVGQIYSLIEDSVKNEFRKDLEDEIRSTLESLTGYRSMIYPDQLYFDIFVRRIVECYRAPLKSAIKRIKSILTSAIDASCKQVLAGYPKFQERVLDLVKTNLNSCEKQTIDQLMTFIDAQGAFVNVDHPQCKNILSHKSKEQPRPRLVEQKKDYSNEDLLDENLSNKEATVEGKTSRMKFSFSRSPGLKSKKHSLSKESLHCKGMILKSL